jgi:hypothetical protein
MNSIKDFRKTGERSHHKTLSPSSLPAIMQCACYAGRGESDDDAAKGNQLHDATMDLCIDKKPKGLEKSELEACEWAKTETLALFEQYDSGEEIRMEEQLKVVNGKGVVISSGYADFNSTHVVIDLKSGLDFRPDLHYYKPQLCDYALAVMQRSNIDRVLCVELYILPNKKREYWVTKTECETIIACCIARRSNPDKKPLLNDYCKWCARLIWCSAVNAIAWRTVELYAKANGMEELFACPEKITCAETVAQALTISKKILKPLQERIEDAALKFSEKNQIPYYIRTKSNPREKIVDVRAAFNRLPLDNKEFSAALSTTPKAVAEIYAEKFDIPEAQAKSVVYGLLDTLIVKGESNPTLKPLLHNQTKKKYK